MFFFLPIDKKKSFGGNHNKVEHLVLRLGAHSETSYKQTYTQIA